MKGIILRVVIQNKLLIYWTLANLDPNDRALMWYKKGFVPIETIVFKKLGV